MKVEDKPLESIAHDVSSAVLTSIISIIPFVWRSLESSQQMSALVHLSELYRAGPATRLHTICYIHQAGSWKPWTWMNLASLEAEVVMASKQSSLRVPDVWSPPARHHRQGVVHWERTRMSCTAITWHRVTRQGNGWGGWTTITGRSCLWWITRSVHGCFLK